MGHILLLGAGFSRNWGGLLANEVFEYLIGQKDVAQDGYLKNLLWNHKTAGGFENALADVQIAFARDPAGYGPSLRTLQAAVSNVFQQINQAFFNAPWMEFQQHLDRTIRTFLVRFDAIFTLNQDVLLEHHYFRHVGLTGPRRWDGAQLPGLRRIPNDAMTVDPSWGKDTWVPLEEQSFRIETRLQPCFKLHGSSNWKDSEGGSLLVIGGDKSRAIRSHAVLAWSFEQFRQQLFQPRSRLFVIGYGFRDQHINDVIVEAVNRHELGFFVIDPFGSDVVRRANPSFGGSIYVPGALDDAFKQGLIGASQRSLSETFGNDQISHDYVLGFFE
jgi:hypothetical protein